MNTLKAKPINVVDFLPYGFIADISSPENAYALGEYPCAFSRDMVTMPFTDCSAPAFGSLKTGKRPFIIEDVEYHSKGYEAMLPLDDDMVIHVGPANGGQVETDKLEAFILPRGTMAVLKPGTWHGAPYPINNDGTVLICLPERTYINDTVKYILNDSDKLEITL